MAILVSDMAVVVMAAVHATLPGFQIVSTKINIGTTASMTWQGVTSHA